jgi:hypothetical protein
MNKIRLFDKYRYVGIDRGYCSKDGGHKDVIKFLKRNNIKFNIIKAESDKLEILNQKDVRLIEEESIALIDGIVTRFNFDLQKVDTN